MKKDNIKIGIWGLGAMGKGMAEMLSSKKGVEIVGVCDIDKNIVGKKLSEVIKFRNKDFRDCVITDNIDEMLKTNMDLCLTATDSHTKGAFPRLKKVLEAGINIVSTAEEMAYPKAQEPELTKQLDEIAKKNKVTVLGTGINPGLMMDLLAVCLSGAMIDVEEVECKRVNSLSPFGPTVMEEQGVGITLDDFNSKLKTNSLAGHVGFAESVGMISEGLGLTFDKFEQQMEPIVTTVDRKSPYGFAKAGNVAGVNMTAQATLKGKTIINMIHPQQIEPEMEGTNTGDYITLKGTPEVSMSIKPEVGGGEGTIAMCVNMIPHVINARPGLKTMLDLPVPRAIMGDMRNLLEE